jgi:hypothetical protein
MQTDEKSSPRPRRRRRIWPWALLVLAIAFWFGHEPLLVWGARAAVDKFTPKLGIRLEIGSMQIHLLKPIEFRDVHFEVTNPPASRTDAHADLISLKVNSLGALLFGDGRAFRSATVRGLAGTFDFRKQAIIPQPLPSLSREDQEKLSALLLRFLPERLSLRDLDATFLADGQKYAVSGFNAAFDEAASDELRFQKAVIDAGSIHQEITNGRAITAWKNGALYLSDLRLRNEIVLRDFVGNFVNVGGISLDWELAAYGGTMRGSVVFGEQDHKPEIDASVAITNLPVKPIPDLIALPARADGIIRDARLTFRGNPDEPLDDEIALHLSADNFRWNERGWQSLVVGANYIGRRLYVTAFDLRQEDNRISLGGELTVPEQLRDLATTRYLVNVSADVRDLHALAALAGPPFDELGGQLSLYGSFQSDKGDLTGYLNAQASGITYRTLPPASALLSVIAKDGELQVPYAGVWAANDRLEAKGSVGIAAPHRYTGELTGRIEDLGLYTPVAGEAVAQNVLTGAAMLEWQGDGAGETHSGAFHVTLDNVVTSATPTGLTGEFAGTYSPQNVYFSTVQLTHGALQLNSRLTISSSGVNVMGLKLRRGKLGLLSGEAFVPIDVFALGSGKTLAQAISTQKPVYANFTSGELPVADLIQMAGQKATVRGQIRLNLGASGALPQLQLSGQLTGRDLSATVEDYTLPRTTADIALATEQGNLRIHGSVQTKGFEPLTLQASMPFAYEELPDGGVRFFREDAPLSAQATFPGTSLEIFRPFVPAARHLQGTLAGRVNVGGTIRKPKIDGEITLTGGDIEASTDVPRITALNGRVTMNTSRITLESLRGEAGAGPFEASGWADISRPGDPALHLQLKGSKVLLARDPGLRLRADLDLVADGRGGSGSVSGSVKLVDGRVYKRLEITPLLVQNPVSGPVFTPPVLAGVVPDPFAKWTSNVTIQNAGPFLLMGNLATGEISPDLALAGTLGAPYLAGTVYLKNLQAYLPATTVLIPEGRIYFTQQQPFMPIMDVHARTETSGYNIQMYAYGPLSESKLALRSDPPLSQENLIFLLTTGLTPAGMSGAGLGEAAAGQGGIIILRSLARQLEPLGIDLNSFVNRLSVRVIPPKDVSQSSSIVSELRLTDGFSLTTGRDGYGFYNAGVQYTIRLR